MDEFALNVLPLRAILFQFLFLLVAIALEAIVLDRYLNLGYKISAQYSTTINLLSTFVGWLIYFCVQPLLPQGLKLQLISFMFFEQLYNNGWLSSVFSLIVILSLGIFLGTLLIELKGLDLLEVALDRVEKKEIVPEEKDRFRGRGKQAVRFQPSNKIYAVFVGNAVSFTAILLLLLVRYVEQSYQ